MAKLFLDTIKESPAALLWLVLFVISKVFGQEKGFKGYFLIDIHAPTALHINLSMDDPIAPVYLGTALSISTLIPDRRLLNKTLN